MMKTILKFLWENIPSFRNEVFTKWVETTLDPLKVKYNKACKDLECLEIQIAGLTKDNASLIDSNTSFKKTIANQKKELKNLNAKIEELEMMCKDTVAVGEMPVTDEKVMETPIVGPGDGAGVPLVNKSKKKRK